jgi:hypothetical protein
MEVFWITAWKPLATAKLAMKSITKPGKKAKFKPVTPQGGGAKELKYTPLTVAELQQMEVPESCGGIVIETHTKFGPDQLPEYFWVIGPHWPKIVTLPKVREWIWDVTYYSKRFHTIIKLRFDCYHGITFDSAVEFSHGDRPIKHYVKHNGIEVTGHCETVDPEQFQHTFKQLADEVGLTDHPTIKASCFHSAADEAFCAYVFDENQPRWMDEHSNSLVHRVLTEDADPAYPIYLFSRADYASANAALFPSVSNVHDDAAAFLQYAKDHPIAGEYAVHFFEIGSPTWAQREKRRKKLKDDATELERLGTLKLENGAHGEASLLMGKRGYRFYLTFDHHPEDAIRFPDTDLFKTMKWQLA